MDRRELYQNFLSEFPLEGLANLPLERYTNLNREDSFCYWLESRLNSLGSIWGSSSFKFGIYKYHNKPKEDPKYTSDDAYAWYSKLGNDRTEVYSKVIGDVYHIALAASRGEFNNVDIEGSGLSDIVKWKIAFLYSNGNLVPVYKKEMLVTLAKHYGMAEPEKATQANLNAFLIEKKGDKDIFEFYDELFKVLEEETPKTAKYWIYSPGENASMWEKCLENGIAWIGRDKLGDLSAYKTKKDINKAIQNIYKSDKDSRNKANDLWNYSHSIKPGDILIAKDGFTRIIGRGIVLSEYIPYDEECGLYNVLKVQWTHKGSWPQPEGVHIMKTLTEITNKPYLKKVKELFSETEQTTQSTPTTKTESSERNYWWLVSSPKVWRISSIKPGEVQDYSLYTENGNQRRVFQNFLDAKPGDLVIGYEANPVKKITALAEISKSAEETGNTSIFVKKTRALFEPVTYAQVKENPALSGMEFLKNRNGSLFKLTKEEYEALMDMILEQNPETETVKTAKYTAEDFLSEVFMAEDNYWRLTALLKEKKNIILQGAPGVGKTFSAKRLAYSLMGEKDDSRVTFVQFHQNYSYEDFVMGYKPNEEGGFELHDGVFYKACIKAQNDPDRDHFFIIDEINRGNLSKIFGELLMLIENGYRDKEVRLAYNGEPFSVPENLYIIGMMNTADRSLAMIDYALRRRFSFFEMKPGFDTEGFKAYQDKLNDDTFNKVIDAIKALNITIEKDSSLGSGFCIGHSYFCGKTSVEKSWLRNVVDFDIAPMLREYWFDDKAKADAEIRKLEDIVK